MPSVAVDVMSGDSGAPECIPGALLALVIDPTRVDPRGQPSVIDPALATAPAAVRARLSVHPAATVVGMSEHPREAIRRRKDSSMRIAIDLVKEGRAGAMVSAGNTGALTAMAHFVLKTVGPVEAHPSCRRCRAYTAATPMLDLGATKATALQLAQFATMGSIVARDVFGIADTARRAPQHRRRRHQGPRARAGSARADRASGVNYLGFVEGNHIFDENVDVVVTDGFTGNVALKAMEGLAKLIVEQLRTEFSRNRPAGSPGC